MVKYFYSQNSNHFSNLTTHEWLTLDCFEIANQIDETGASSAETTKTH